MSVGTAVLHRLPLHHSWAESCRSSEAQGVSRGCRPPTVWGALWLCLPSGHTSVLGTVVGPGTHACPSYCRAGVWQHSQEVPEEVGLFLCCVSQAG